MRISAVEEYGLRCLMALARVGTEGQLSISEIAEAEGLSVPYASKLLAILRRAGLVTAERGRGGGFSIARDPAQITLYDVMTALGGPLIDPQHCQKYSGHAKECVHLGKCSISDVLGGVAGYVQSFLGQTSMADLLTSEKAKELRLNQEHIRIGQAALEDELNQPAGRIFLE